MMKNEVIAMIESRLFKIIYHLMEKGQATAPELAEKFEPGRSTLLKCDCISFGPLTFKT